jgi:hypothetical protein
MTDVQLWEILVPTEMIRGGEMKPISVRYHQIWDENVRKIAGGLTIFKPAKGQWLSPSNELHMERMIPVRIACTEQQIDEIADMSAAYYNQEAIMRYRISDLVKITHYKNQK